MVRIDILKGKLREKGKTYEDIAQLLGCTHATFCNKLNNGGEKFTISEVRKIVDHLGLTKEEVDAIFFAPYVADSRQEGTE